MVLRHLPTTFAAAKKCYLSSLALRTATNPTYIFTLGSINSSQPYILFRKGIRGSLDAFLRGQHKRDSDKIVWRRLLLLARYGPYYDDVYPQMPARLPTVDEDENADYWRSVAAAPSIYEAMRRLVADERLQFVDHPDFPMAQSLFLPSDEQLSPPPTWLVMHLITNKVKSVRDARISLDLAINQLPHTPQSLQFPLMLLVIHRLVKYSQGSPLLPIIDALLELPTTNPEYHLRELLTLCSQLPTTDTSRQLLLGILQKMKSLEVSVDHNLLSKLAVYRAVYPDIAALLPLTKASTHLRKHDLKRNSYIALDSSSIYRHQRTSRLAKMTWSEALQALKNDPTYSQSQKIRLDSHEWTALTTSIGRDRNVGLIPLRAFWERMVALRGKALDTPCQTAMMDAFRMRGSYKDAMQIWDSLLKTPSSIDKRALMGGILTISGTGDLKNAFDTMDAFALKNYHPETRRDPNHAREVRGRIQLDTALINALMDRLNRGGRPDIVFKLWDIMEKYYNIMPDGITVTILLDSARRAYLIDPSMELALGQLGISNPFKGVFSQRKVQETPSEMISRLLDSPPESGFWHGDWAFVNARAIFRDAVLGNWPQLQAIECPVGTHIPKPSSGSLWETSDPSPQMRWPTIIPSSRAFHAYIFLLGWNELQAEIPLALAWMRALQIEPLHRTLCAALMYFGEIARLPPMFESFELQRGQEYGGDYGRLRRWIADWIGEAALPSENVVASYRRGDGKQVMRWYGRKY